MLVLKTKYQKLSCVAFAPDGRGLAAAGDRGTYWWSNVFENPKAVRLRDEWCGGAGFTTDGAVLISFQEGVGVCATDLANRSHKVAPVAGALRPTIVVCSATGFAVLDSTYRGELSGWHIGPDGAPVHVWTRNAGLGSSGSFAPDGSLFVRSARTGERWQGYRLLLHDPATGAVVGSCEGSDLVTCGPAVSPDKEWLAFSDQNLFIAQSVTDPSRRASVRNDNTHQFTEFVFHPSGRFLAATNNDSTVKLYDTTAWEITRTFTWDIGRMRCVAFSPDGTRRCGER